MNPLKALNEDCMHLILENLTVRDLLKCSLVSREWNKLIGQSPAAMSKIWLRFYEPINEVGVLLESSRQYTNLKCQFNIPKKLLLVLKKFKWKNVMLRDFNLEYATFIETLSYFAPTVESLDIWDIDIIMKSTNNFTQLNFPRLKNLELNLTHRCVFSIFLGHNPLLKKLSIRNESAKFTNIEKDFLEPTNIIHEILTKNKFDAIKLLYCEFALEHDDNLIQGLVAKNNLKELTVTSDFTRGEHKNYSISRLISLKRTVEISRIEVCGASIVTVQFVA